MQEIYLTPMTRELFHTYYKGYQNDPGCYRYVHRYYRYDRPQSKFIK